MNVEDELADGVAVGVSPRVLSQVECTHFTQLMPGVWVSWQCRNKACGGSRGAFYGPNDSKTWLQAIDSEHFRCPVCKVFYQPWAGNSQNGQPKELEEPGGGKRANPLAKALPYQRVLTFTNPLNGEEQAIPVSWPSNREDRWVNDQIEAQVLSLQTQDMGSAEEAYNKGILDLDLAVGKQVFPHSWNKIEWSSTGVEMLTPPKFAESNYKSQQDHGVVGAFFPWQEYVVEDPETGREQMYVWKDWELLIGLFAQVIAAGRKLLERAEQAPSCGCRRSWREV